MRGHYPRALELVDRVAGDPTPVGLHGLRGDIYARMDRPADAEREFLEEIRLSPRSPDPRVKLAVVFASQHRENDAKRVIEQMVAEIPAATPS
jgi:Flp pilus assembly protein TadD